MAGPLLHIIPQKCLSTCMKAEASPQPSFQGRVLSEWARTASNRGALPSGCKGPQRGANTLLGQCWSKLPDPEAHVSHCPLQTDGVALSGQHHRLKGSFGFVCPTSSNLVFCSLNVTDVTVKGPRGITHTGQFPKGRRSVEFLFLQRLAWCLA